MVNISCLFRVQMSLELKYIALIIVFLLYLICSIRGQLKVNSSIVLTRKQKIWNSILLWLIPFLWYYMSKDIINPDNGVMTKKKRDKLLKKDAGGFYESGKGFGY